RKAILLTMDRKALNEGLFDGEQYSREISVPPDSPQYAEVERAVTRYGFDPPQAAQRMTSAGYARDRDGMYVNVAGERLTTDVKVTAGPQFERGNAILIDVWRQNGFDMAGSVVAAAEARDREARQTFTGMASRGASEILRIFLTSEVGAPSN